MTNSAPIYFDNSATTKPSPEVLQSMMEVLEQFYGNPSSLHHYGVKAEQLITKSKDLCARMIGVKSSEIYFTSGGTESNNLALKGIAFGYQDRGRHIITTQIEHSSVFDVCQELEHRHGFEVTYLPVDEDGIIAVDDVHKALREDTILVSIMHVNNELGSIQPIEAIGKLLSQYPKVFFHVDQIQGIGKAPLSIEQGNIDLLSLSGHKIHAPKGTGMLYIRDRAQQLYPLFHGGSQQARTRPGTENVAGIVAFTKALRMLKDHEEQNLQHLKKLRRKMLAGLKDIQGVQINSPLEEQKSGPHILNISFVGIKPEVLLHALEDKGIYVSTKSACSSKTDRPSRILLAKGCAEDIAGSALRISFSPTNSLEEVDYCIRVLQEIIPEYQRILKV